MPAFVCFFSVGGAARYTSLVYSHLCESIVNTTSLARLCDAIIEEGLDTLDPPNNRAVSMIRLFVSSEIAECASGTRISPKAKNGMKSLAMEDHGVSYHRGLKATVNKKKHGGKHNGKHVDKVRESKSQTFAVWAGFPVWFGANRQTFTILDDGVLNMGNADTAHSILHNEKHEGFKIVVEGRTMYDLPGMDCAGRLSGMLFERTGFIQLASLCDLFATQIIGQIKRARLFEYPLNRLIQEYPDWSDEDLQIECLHSFFDFDRIECAREFLDQHPTHTAEAQRGGFCLLMLLEVCVCVCVVAFCR